MSKKRLLVFRPTLGQGGADRNTVILLRYLERRYFSSITLALMKKVGEFVEDVPRDVEIVELGVPSLWRAWRPLAQLIRTTRPDIVFSTSSGGNLAMALAHEWTGSLARLVLSERARVSTGDTRAIRGLQRGLKRALYPKADCVTVISECLGRDVVQALGVSPDRIAVVYNPALDAALLEGTTAPLDHQLFAAGQPTVLAAGRLVDQKDYPTLLRAFAMVRAVRPANLAILGEGPMRGELNRLARQLGIEDGITFLGFDKNPFKYMSRCAVFVLSSKHEGFGSVLAQAMACGAAVVATDCPCGPSEIIAEPGRDGFLVPVGDATALAERMRSLLDNEELRQATGLRARESARRFAAEAIVKRYTAALLGP